jgi:hypothetical protein
VTAADVLAATAGVAVGIEVLDSRYRDYRFTIGDVVADNTSAGRFVVGAAVPPAGIDLRLVGVVFERNGEMVATAGRRRGARSPRGRGGVAGPRAGRGRQRPAGRRDRAVRGPDGRGPGRAGRRARARPWTGWAHSS